MVRALIFFATASLLAGCGGGATTPLPTPNGDSHLTATPSSIQINNLSGMPQLQTVSIGGFQAADAAAPLGFTATDLSFLGLSLQVPNGTGITLNVLIVGAGTSTITVSQGGSNVSIPVTSIPCGRPDILQYAKLVSPASGSANVPLNTSAFYVEVAGAPQVSPFEPSLHAHFVVNNRTTIDPEATPAPATPLPLLPIDLPTPPPGDSVGFESGAMPQLTAGSTYTLYVYSDACQPPWKAGSFST